MPLPDHATLSLHVNSSAVQSKPKHAMIVRMSAETLDALDAFPNHPPLSFDFGDVPGIYIGDAFFPMRPQKESSPHELYLRASSAAKPMAPLKLYANVIGKFMVEPQLGDKVTHKIRQQTMVAKQHHMERQAILLDQPPIPPPGHKSVKRKAPGSGTVVKKAALQDQNRLAPSTVPSHRASPLPQPSKASADVRRRLVHCLAISPRLSDDAVKMVGGANLSPAARDDLVALLEDVAEQHTPAKKGDKAPRPWTLKPQTWTEVRPYEWPKLTEAERITMARQARMAFKALKIPESDPAWDNVRYRPTAPAVPTSVPTPPPAITSGSSKTSTTAQVENKRIAITTKDAKLKSKHDSQRTKGEVQMKDKSTKTSAAPRLNAIKRTEAGRPTSPSDGSSAAKALASRRLPGSGYQVKKSPQPSTSVGERSGTPVDARAAPKPPLPSSLPQKPLSATPPVGGTHARKTVPAIPPKPAKKVDESDRERDREHERQKEREHEKRERGKEKQPEEREREQDQERIEKEKREKAKPKERETAEQEKRWREKVRERAEMEADKRQRDNERNEKESVAGNTIPAPKRKTATQDTEATHDGASSKAPQPKRRKLDDGLPVATSPSKVRDAELPRKPAHEPTPDPRLKMKKDPSSPQASLSSQDRRGATSTIGPTHKQDRPSKASSSTKPRRRSPIYTSSEDEGEIPQPRRRNPSPPPISDRSNSSDQQPSEKGSYRHRTTRGVYPAPTDHTALRALYQSQYTTYLGAFSKVVAQKRKIEAMLNGDSEAEVDVMDLDELSKLSKEHKSLKTELEHIRDIYTRGTTGTTASGSTSD